MGDSLAEAVQGKPTKLLYAVAYHRMSSGRWMPAPMFYTRAFSAAEAWANCTKSQPRRRLLKIAVAPAVGYFVEDNHGEKLSAT